MAVSSFSLASVYLIFFVVLYVVVPELIFLFHSNIFQIPVVLHFNSFVYFVNFVFNNFNSIPNFYLISLIRIVSIWIFLMIKDIRILQLRAFFVNLLLCVLILKLLMSRLISEFLFHRHWMVIAFIKVSKIIITRASNSPWIYCWTY